MQTVLQILKASSWGLLLLIFVLLFTGEAFLAYWNADSLIPAAVTVQAKKTVAEVGKRIEYYKYLKNQIDAKNARDGTYWSEWTDPDLKAQREKITNGLESTCSDCGVSFMPGLSMYRYSADGVLDRLKKLSDPAEVSHFNTIIYVAIVFALLSIALLAYLIVALFRYKKLGLRGLVLLVAIAAPLLVALMAMSLIRVGDYWEITFTDSSDFIVYVGVFCVLYCFVVYPPTFYLSKTKGIKTKQALLLREC